MIKWKRISIYMAIFMEQVVRPRLYRTDVVAWKMFALLRERRIDFEKVARNLALLDGHYSVSISASVTATVSPNAGRGLGQTQRATLGNDTSASLSDRLQPKLLAFVLRAARTAAKVQCSVERLNRLPWKSLGIMATQDTARLPLRRVTPSYSFDC